MLGVERELSESQTNFRSRRVRLGTPVLLGKAELETATNVAGSVSVRGLLRTGGGVLQFGAPSLRVGVHRDIFEGKRFSTSQSGI